MGVSELALMDRRRTRQTTLRLEFRDGNDIYGVVFGPYLTQSEACDAVVFGLPDAYVLPISTTDPEDHTVEC